MAKYGISSEGVSALTQLAADMSRLNDDIESNQQQKLPHKTISKNTKKSSHRAKITKNRKQT